MADFGPGDQLRAVSSNSVCVIEEYLDGGTQGDVYRASVDGATVAAKWYLDTYCKLCPEQRGILEDLVKHGPPDHRFLWPLDIVEADGRPGFGYLMPFRGPEFVGFNDLARGRVRPSMFALARAGFELADSFYNLHTGQGLCYRDINFGNLFLDPATGRIAICDNDNVGCTGQSAGVVGTMGFMAPEIVRGEASTQRSTDLWSLAVMLFYLFMRDNPLLGALAAGVKIEDGAAERWLYGDHPVFVFDPDDPSNYPVNNEEDGYQVNAIARWPILPTATQQLFVQAFTVGSREPDRRVQENEWRQAMVELGDGWFKCGCGAECFHDVLAMGARPDHQPRPCWHCGKSPTLPPRMQIVDAYGSNATVVLGRGKKLYPHHLGASSLFDFSRVLAEVVPDPRSAGQFVLRNASSESWTVRRDDGTVVEVGTGKAVALTDRRQIVFGAKTGTVRL